jgi:hypothetical protein
VLRVTYQSSTELRVLLALALKGFAEDVTISTATGVGLPDVQTHVKAAAGMGTVDRREGRIVGWHLTKAGREWLVSLLAEERAQVGGAPSVESAYEDFLELNRPFKGLCTAAQTVTTQNADVAGLLTAEAAADGDSPVDLRAELEQIHVALAPVLDKAAGELARFGSYRGRFEAAKARLDAGDDGALAQPLSNSYHDVWMELHQDLLKTLDRSRTEADGD